MLYNPFWGQRVQMFKGKNPMRKELTPELPRKTEKSWTSGSTTSRSTFASFTCAFVRNWAKWWLLYKFHRLDLVWLHFMSLWVSNQAKTSFIWDIEDSGCKHTKVSKIKNLNILERNGWPRLWIPLSDNQSAPSSISTLSTAWGSTPSGLSSQTCSWSS